MYDCVRICTPQWVLLPMEAEESIRPLELELHAIEPSDFKSIIISGYSSKELKENMAMMNEQRLYKNQSYYLSIPIHTIQSILRGRLRTTMHTCTIFSIYLFIYNYLCPWVYPGNSSLGLFFFNLKFCSMYPVAQVEWIEFPVFTYLKMLFYLKEKSFCLFSFLHFFQLSKNCSGIF